MTALTSDRNTPERAPGLRHGSVAAAVTIWAGSIVMRDAAGNILPGKTATGLVGVGRAAERIDNASGPAGAMTALYEPGVFAYTNSAGADEITAADIGKKCFAVDDQTVAKTDASATRSPAGIIHDIDAKGVWVRFDEALTRAS